MKNCILFCGLIFFFYNSYSQIHTVPDTSVQYKFTIGGRAPILVSSYRVGQIAYDGNKYFYFATVEGMLSKVDTATGLTVKEITSPTFQGKPFHVKSWAYTLNKIYAIVDIQLNYPLSGNTRVLALMDTAMQIQSIDKKLGTNVYSLTTNTHTGDLWVYVQDSLKIFKYDWDSQTILKSITPKKDGIDILQVDDLENVYLGYLGGYNIQKLDNTGKLVLSFPVSCVDFRLINNTKLIVIDGLDNKIVTYNAETAAEISRITLKNHPLIPNFKLPVAVEIQPNGNMWVLDIGKYGMNNTIGGPLLYKIKADGTWISCYGTIANASKSSSLTISTPDLVTVDSRGWIYTASSVDQQKIEEYYYGPGNLSYFPVYIFMPDGRLITRLNKTETTQITAMEGGSNNNFALSYIYDPKEYMDYAFDTLQMHFYAAKNNDCVFGSNNKIYYINKVNGFFGDESLLSEWDMKTKVSIPLGKIGNDVADDEVFHPNGIARNSKGEFIITDFAQHMVYIIDSTGQNMRIHHHYGNREIEVKGPARVVVDQYDNIFITEAWNDRLKITDSDGNLIQNIGFPQWKTVFNAPSDIAIDTVRHQLYIADRNNNRIQVYKLNYPFKTATKSFKETLKVSKLDTLTCEMYPNPMHETLTITTNSNIKKVSIYTAFGFLVQTEEPTIESTEYVLNLNNQIQSNVYIVKVETENGVSNAKIFKQ